MQAPHPSLIQDNAAFAELLPKLEARIASLLHPSEHEEVRLQLAEATRQWAKLTIMWDELQGVLQDPQYQELTRSLQDHITKVQFEARYEEDLAACKVPATHTFIERPSNLDARLIILSDILAARLDERLAPLQALHAKSGADTDFKAEKDFRDAQTKEYRTANDVLRQNIASSIAGLYETVSGTLDMQGDYLEKVKHGSVERFTSAYLAYHEAASVALLRKSEASLHSAISTIYTPDMCRALQDHIKDIRSKTPLLQERLHEINDEIAHRETLETPEYLAAVKEYHALKQSIEQAERDIDKLMHYTYTS